MWTSIYKKLTNSKVENRKFRHEYKFLCDMRDIAVLESRLSGFMQKDINAGEAGYYHIRSVYFDDIFDTCYNKNESGVDKRAKYRIRIYNYSDSQIRLEKKIKENGKTRKLSAPLTKEQCDFLLQGKVLPMDEIHMAEYPKLLIQFLVLMKTRGFAPKVIVSYDRIPYVYKQGNVRVTFDKNIASSTDFSHFFERDMQKRPILPKGRHLMEIKYDEFLPAFLKSGLELGQLRQTTFSKYYLCRKYGFEKKA